MSGAGIRQKKGSVHTIHAYTRLKLMTGIARNHLLRLISASLKEDGIHIQRYKTATKTGSGRSTSGNLSFVQRWKWQNRHGRAFASLVLYGLKMG